MTGVKLKLLLLDVLPESNLVFDRALNKIE